MTVKIFHFYHVYADGLWKPSIDDHISALIDSKLYNNLNKMFIGFVGNNENILEAKQYLNDYINYEVVDEQPSGWEQVTLEHLKNFSNKNSDECVFYAHTKGSWDSSLINKNWRKSMTYYNIIKWKECFEQLKLVDTVGCHWVSSQGPHGIWGGNYWWAKCEYIIKLPKLEYNNRHDAEGWIGSVKEKTIFDMNAGFPSMGLFKTEW